MKAGNMPFQDPADKIPIDVLQKFIGVFASKGWLNRSLRIMHRGKKYRIFCSKTEFIAHRINDHCAVSWGFPCWAVCIVTPAQIIEDSNLSVFESAEPSVHDWLRCIAEDDFKII
jgi:hypothetical protein